MSSTQSPHCVCRHTFICHHDGGALQLAGWSPEAVMHSLLKKPRSMGQEARGQVSMFLLTRDTSCQLVSAREFCCNTCTGTTGRQIHGSVPARDHHRMNDHIYDHIMRKQSCRGHMCIAEPPPCRSCTCSDVLPRSPGVAPMHAARLRHDVHMMRAMRGLQA